MRRSKSDQKSSVSMLLRVLNLMYVDEDDTPYLHGEKLGPRPPWSSNIALGLTEEMLEEIDKLGVVSGDTVEVKAIKGGKGMMCTSVKIEKRGGQSRLKAVQWPAEHKRLPPLPWGTTQSSEDE